MKKRTIVLAGMLLAAVSSAAGYASAPEDFQLPVLLADGEVIMQPCYVTADGECIALVDSEETAKKVMKQVKAEYKNEDTVQMEVLEKTSTKTMALENGDEKPEILSAEEAAEQIVKERSMTVETTEVIVEEQEVDYETIEKETEELHAGEIEIQQTGEKGIKEITKTVTRENGEIIHEEITDETVIKEAIDQVQLIGTAGLADPLDTLRVTSCFGPRWGRQHLGVDFGIEEGTDIYAAKAGTVICAEYSGSYGNLVKIDHGDGLETCYAHCSRILVQEGQQVDAGQVIAEVGSTGNSTGPHLHFEVRVDGQVTDPLEWLDDSDT